MNVWTAILFNALPLLPIHISATLQSSCGSGGSMYIQSGNPACSCRTGYVYGADKWTCIGMQPCLEGGSGEGGRVGGVKGGGWEG